MPKSNDNTPSQGEATRLLVAWSGGDRAALDQLMPLVLGDLRRRAQHLLSGQPVGHTLQPDGLVNEAFIKLVTTPERSWQNRAHFLAVAARAMRHILIDHARTRLCSKRSGTWRRLSDENALLTPVDTPNDWLALDEALRKLEDINPRAAAVVEMRCFVGAAVEEVAEALKISRITVLRDWKFAVDWLRDELGPPRM